MRVIKTILYTFLVVAGIMLASVNMEPVNFIYLPAVPFSPVPEGAALELPLSLAILAAVVLGTLIAGTGSLVEHIRLRAGVRKQTKRNDRLQKEMEGVRGELQQAVRRAEEAEERANQAGKRAEAAERSGAEATAGAGDAQLAAEDVDDEVA